MRKLSIIYALFITVLSGCVSLEHVTLPASKEKEYEFYSYSFTPLDKSEWRFYGMNKELQRLALLNANHESMIYFWITPIVTDTSDDEQARNIIEYFQNKELKEIRKSPDVELTKENYSKRKELIGEYEFDILSLEYVFDKQPVSIDFYYYKSEESQIIHNFCIVKGEKLKKEILWKDQLLEDFKQMVKQTEFKVPTAKQISSIRVDYAGDYFNESLEDRYLAEKAEIIKNKYNAYLTELHNWAAEEGNYRAYYLLGDLACFNSQFEKYGKDFDEKKALDYFVKVLNIRPYHKGTYENIALIYKAVNNIEKEIEAYEMLIKISPNTDDPYYQLGGIYEKKGDLKEAKKYYQNALRYWSSGLITKDELKTKINKL